MVGWGDAKDTLEDAWSGGGGGGSSDDDDEDDNDPPEDDNDDDNFGGSSRFGGGDDDDDDDDDDNVFDVDPDPAANEANVDEVAEENTGTTSPNAGDATDDTSASDLAPDTSDVFQDDDDDDDDGSNSFMSRDEYESTVDDSPSGRDRSVADRVEDRQQPTYDDSDDGDSSDSDSDDDDSVVWDDDFEVDPDGNTVAGQDAEAFVDEVATATNNGVDPENIFANGQPEDVDNQPEEVPPEYYTALIEELRQDETGPSSQQPDPEVIEQRIRELDQQRAEVQERIDELEQREEELSQQEQQTLQRLREEEQALEEQRAELQRRERQLQRQAQQIQQAQAQRAQQPPRRGKQAQQGGVGTLAAGAIETMAENPAATTAGVVGVVVVAEALGWIDLSGKLMAVLP